jgi:hypothetical protein
MKMENAATKIKLPIAKPQTRLREALQNDERVFLMGRRRAIRRRFAVSKVLEEFGEERHGHSAF